MPSETVALYPGTFDPVTNGHLDIIYRASRLFDRLIVAVAANEEKGPLFPTEERTALLREAVAPLSSNGVQIEIRSFQSLLVHFAAEVGAAMIVRGLRAVSDFEFEFQMAAMNAKLGPSIETVFLMASDRNQFISSRFVKEIARLGGDVSAFVPAKVADRLAKRFGNSPAVPG